MDTERTAWTAGGLLLIGAAACAASGSLVLRTLAQGQTSPVEKPLRQVARTPAEWNALWARHLGATAGGKPAPKLDFTREMGAAVFLGTRPSGGYSVEIRDAREQKGHLVITVVE